MQILVIKKENILTAFLLIAMCICIFSLLQPEIIDAFMPISKKVVIIDAGHGGWLPYHY